MAEHPSQAERQLFLFHTISIDELSIAAEAILCSPFEWRLVKGGAVNLSDASGYGGTKGGSYQVSDFALAKYPVTNAQYERFIIHPNGHTYSGWWEFSSQASQWRKDHPNPQPTAFKGQDLPRTRVSWFDSMAFCLWLSVELLKQIGESQHGPIHPQKIATWPVRLPTEQEWQRAALGDTGRRYPWGDTLAERYANYAGCVGQPTSVRQYPEGKSEYGVMDLIGNAWEWCLTGWGMETVDLGGYTYRIIRGGAWNIGNPDYLRADDRGCHPPRGQLNDCGFRCSFFFNGQSRME